VDTLGTLGRTLGFSLGAGINLYATVAMLAMSHPAIAFLVTIAALASIAFFATWIVAALRRRFTRPSGRNGFAA
jgi:hypothetical protein